MNDIHDTYRLDRSVIVLIDIRVDNLLALHDSRRFLTLLRGSPDNKTRDVVRSAGNVMQDSTLAPLWDFDS
jgi:hypothetical protein